MKSISAKEFQQYREWARNCRSNQVYPLSIAEGVQTGDIFAEEGVQMSDIFTEDGIRVGNTFNADTESPRAVLFWHYCGFGYLSGKAGPAFLKEIYERFFLAETERRFLLITDDNEVVRYFSEKKDLIIGRRPEYFYGGDRDTIPVEAGACCTENNLDFISDGAEIRVEKLNEELLARLEGRIIPPFSWDNEQRFLTHGFGYAVMENEEIAATAFSAAVSSEEIDIGVETREPYRKRGYARLLTEKMCREIVSLGKRPVWAHAAENAASRETALACGFIESKINFVIRKRML